MTLVTWVVCLRSKQVLIRPCPCYISCCCCLACTPQKAKLELLSIKGQFDLLFPIITKPVLEAYIHKP